MGNKQAFVDFVLDWCRDDGHGYSQANRWGPDCDCSSLMYMAARHAGYDVPTSGTRYTGTMLDHFQSAGFVAVGFDGNVYDCPPGSIALNVVNHVEAFVDWGRLGGAHLDEHGGVQGCCTGDQTGNEVSEGPAYIPSYGWDYILLPPDDTEWSGDPETVPEASLPMPRYRVKTCEDGWLSWLTGLRCDCVCGDTHAGIAGHYIYDVEFDMASLGAGGWYRIERADGSSSTNSSGNTSSPVTGLVVYYGTPNPIQTGYYKAEYRAHWIGVSPSWGKWEHDDEDGGAGKDERSPLDMIQVTIGKA